VTRPPDPMMRVPEFVRALPEPSLSEAAWHERLRRRLEPATFDARHRALVHEWLAIVSGRPRRLVEVVDGRCR
jgi:hypothetical protein